MLAAADRRTTPSSPSRTTTWPRSMRPRGDYGKARAELEETLRLQPGYATAHENLGDVYAVLAAQSYAKALRLEPASADAAAQARARAPARAAPAAARVACARLGLGR